MLLANSIIFDLDTILHTQSVLDWSSVGPKWAALVHARLFLHKISFRELRESDFLLIIPIGPR